MLKNTLFVFLIVSCLSGIVHGDIEAEYYLKDYTYIEAVHSFYKIHTVPQTWADAKQECAEEGASLFYPENVDEQNAVLSFRNTTKPDVWWVYLGLSDLTTEGMFETVDGKPLSEVYSNWKTGEPNNANGEEHCVEQDKEGKMNDVTCSKKFSFICNKKLPTVEQNNTCNKDGDSDKEFTRKNYTYIEAVNSFYKIHGTSQTWSDAKLVCALEGAILFYPENYDEQNAVLSFRKTTQPKVGWVFLGISDLKTKGVFETVDGKPLSQVYSNWKLNEPNNANGEEDCVEQDDEGKMNDVKCSQKFSFICKKSLPTAEQNTSCSTNGESDKNITEKDYTYIEAVHSLYKIHTTPQNWSDAKLECSLEGASLYYPENVDEQNAVLSFRNTTKPDVWWVYLGLSDLTNEGVFETVDGKPLSEMYSNWKTDEPNNANGEEHCVEQDKEGKMNDVKCSKKFSFICKKKIPTVEQNNSCKTGNRDKNFTGKDFTYIETVNSFYKIHTTPQNWSDAKLECALEGASLFYPENSDEQNAVLSFRKTTQPKVKWVFLGISDLKTKGVFETVDGKLLSEVYSSWKTNEPNDANGEEDCVEQDDEGKMNDVKCSQKFSFICKKSLPTAEQNTSCSTNGESDKNITGKDYTYIEAVHSLYKIHTTPQNWSDAKLECIREGASLYYPETVDEQNAVLSFRNTTKPDVWWVYLGISNLATEGEFETVDGNLLSDMYSNWKTGEPNNANGEEHCVEQDKEGKMNDVTCSKKFSFICKKSLPTVEQNNSYNTDGETDKDFPASDYTYLETENSFYKIHTTPQNWFDANLDCTQEGASLFYPENYDEQNAVMSFLNTTQPKVGWVFVGISDLTIERVFETVDGKPLSEVYSNWKPNEPNNLNNEEHCVEQDKTGKMNDVNCSKKFSYICKKKLPSPDENNTHNPDGPTNKVFFRKDFTYIEAVNSFYKIHTTPQNWSNAKLECTVEGANLFYPENDDEQNAVMSFLNKTQPKVGWVFVGISDLMNEGEFETIDGKPLSEVYSNWKPNEPNNLNNEEHCVEQDKTGKMNDVNCSKKFSYICKKKLPSPDENNTHNLDGPTDKVFFRKDYTYIAEVNSFYKIHTTPQTWSGAKLECALEGANLFFPENDEEQNAVTSFRNTTHPEINRVFVGISNQTSEEVFETISGRTIYDVYNQWRPDKPKDDNGEDCLEQNNAGEMNYCNCSEKLPFICKKSLLQAERNTTCNIDYSFDENTFKCYKLHSTPLKWVAAYAVCRSEEAHLANINNRMEGNYLANLIAASKQSIEGNHQMYRGIFHLGFHYSFEEGWQTVKGTPFKIDDDAWWNKNQPIIDEKEQCGSMFYNGRLLSVDCDTKSFFICEHEIDATKITEEMFL